MFGSKELEFRRVEHESCLLEEEEKVAYSMVTNNAKSQWHTETKAHLRPATSPEQVGRRALCLAASSGLIFCSCHLKALRLVVAKGYGEPHTSS